MKAFKYILFLLLISFIGSAIYITVQPNSFKIEKSKTIHAPIGIVYNNILNLKSWNNKYGKVTIKTIDTITNSYIKQIIEFENFPTCEINWQLKSIRNNEIEVSCSMLVNYLPFGYKISSAIKGSKKHETENDLKKELNKLELTTIKSLEAYKIKIDDIIFYEGGYYVYNNASCKATDLRSKINDVMPKLANRIKNDTITKAGKPFIIYNNRNRQSKTINFSYCIPTTEQIISKDSTFLTGNLESFIALKVTLNGNLKNIEEARRVANTYLKKKNLYTDKTGFEMEVYVTDPSKTVNPADLITEIYIAID